MQEKKKIRYDAVALGASDILTAAAAPGLQQRLYVNFEEEGIL